MCIWKQVQRRKNRKRKLGKIFVEFSYSWWRKSVLFHSLCSLQYLVEETVHYIVCLGNYKHSSVHYGLDCGPFHFLCYFYLDREWWAWI
jgi:hypothetical protein